MLTIVSARLVLLFYLIVLGNCQAVNYGKPSETQRVVYGTTTQTTVTCCNWTSWTEFSPCSNDCGGTQWRKTICQCLDKSGKLVDSKDSSCTTPPTYETQQCDLTSDCCSFQEWSEWSHCGASCGTSTRFRTQRCVCINSGVVTYEESSSCAGEPKTEIEYCRALPCCEWSGNTEWSSCDTSCANGTKWRKQRCYCPGSDSSTTADTITDDSFCTGVPQVEVAKCKTNPVLCIDRPITSSSSTLGYKPLKSKRGTHEIEERIPYCDEINQHSTSTYSSTQSSSSSSQLNIVNNNNGGNTIKTVNNVVNSPTPITTNNNNDDDNNDDDNDDDENGTYVDDADSEDFKEAQSRIKKKLDQKITKTKNPSKFMIEEKTKGGSSSSGSGGSGAASSSGRGADVKNTKNKNGKKTKKETSSTIRPNNAKSYINNNNNNHINYNNNNANNHNNNNYNNNNVRPSSQNAPKFASRNPYY
eukprot:TRINITY_DN3865_c2_g1_i2.p1 TRINITY_DN3865_c2_g1~~TRINITY_DN3865_c2_g1_i2.p1  ORF type:complete len:472 (+),score=124.32 TRINITY_DN3865_c2_g1_i2:51-1466(+)